MSSMPPSITITPESAGERPAVRALVTEAFGDEGPLIAQLIDALDASPDRIDGLSLVAREGTAHGERGDLSTERPEPAQDDASAGGPDTTQDAASGRSPQPLAAGHSVASSAANSAVAMPTAATSGRIVGHVMGTRGYLDTRDRLVDVVVLSPLAVLPDAQGRGIGAALIESLVSAAAEAGYPCVFLEGDPGYYARHGFRAGRELGMRRPSLRIPEPAFQVRTLPAHEDLMSGTLIYSRVFWDLDCVGLRDPALTEVENALSCPPAR